MGGREGGSIVDWSWLTAGQYCNQEWSETWIAPPMSVLECNVRNRCYFIAMNNTDWQSGTCEYLFSLQLCMCEGRLDCGVWTVKCAENKSRNMPHVERVLPHPLSAFIRTNTLRVSPADSFITNFIRNLSHVKHWLSYQTLTTHQPSLSQNFTWNTHQNIFLWEGHYLKLYQTCTIESPGC